MSDSSGVPPAGDPSPALENGNGQDRSILSNIASRLAQAVRGLRGGSTIRESLEEALEKSTQDTQDLSAQERLMLANLLKFGSLRVYDVMVHRADIVAVEEKTPLYDLLKLFGEAQHSRLPVYRETLDDPIGMVHIKDVVAAIETGVDGALRWQDVSLAKIKRNLLFVPGAMPAIDLLLKMQTTHLHLALVVDEYGGTDGLVSIEDLVEEIVGDIDDEHDTGEEPEIVPRADGGFDAVARMGLEDFKEQTGIDLLFSGEEQDVDTLGGLITGLLGRLPLRGEIVAHPAGYEFEVLEADARRVKRLRIRPIAAKAGPD
jgi:CBS domain containing-hemolysin-like protein